MQIKPENFLGKNASIALQYVDVWTAKSLLQIAGQNANIHASRLRRHHVHS